MSPYVVLVLFLAATWGWQRRRRRHDLRERRRLERALEDLRSHDALTGLPNRHGILEILDARLAARRHGRTLALLVFDIDQFRRINGSHGYAGGDEVLRECVARLSGLLASGDVLARHSGHEFVVVQAQSGREAAARLGESMLGCMRAPFLLGGQRVFLSSSVGIAIAPAGPCTAPRLVQMAQVALAAARANGPAQLCFHRAEMEQVIRDRVDLESMLRHAVRRGQLALQYQPRIGATGCGKVGLEALVRWRHPVLGLVAPALFIPLAEETGIIDELDMWVLREACRRAARWRDEGLPLGRVSVNLSARQFQQAGLTQRVRAALEDSGLEPAGLEIEITETTVMRDTAKTVEVLRSLKALGVALSIDDFGTGYSSLSYLKRFPLDILKIDRSFVKDVVQDPSDAAITRAIIALAHGLGLEAVAEGVETAEQLAFLKDNGCDEFQGYYFSSPVWPEQLEQMFMTEFS
jgi:diguanylate cyclase (GGDEF)-like protein